MDAHDQKHNNRRDVRQRTAEDRNAPIQAVEKTTSYSGASCFIRMPETCRSYRLMKIGSMQSKRRDAHHKGRHHVTNVNTLLIRLELKVVTD